MKHEAVTKHFECNLFQHVYANVTKESNFKPVYTVSVRCPDDKRFMLDLFYDHHRNLLGMNHYQFTGAQIELLQTHYKRYIDDDVEGDVVQYALDASNGHTLDKDDEFGQLIFASDLEEIAVQ